MNGGYENGQELTDEALRLVLLAVALPRCGRRRDRGSDSRNVEKGGENEYKG